MIKKNLHNIQEQIQKSAHKAGRKSEDIQLVAVSKTRPVEDLLEAFNCGQHVFGENYIQEVLDKRPQLPPEARIHFIGHLQSNKAKFAAEFCDMIETVDNVKLARRLNNRLKQTGRTLEILLQVNIGNDPNKSGIAAEETEQLYEQIAPFSQLRITGLMTMPPWENSPEESRKYFSALRELGEELTAKGLFAGKPAKLSMGMSEDFPIAIEEGATIIRIGTALFGERLQKKQGVNPL